MKLKWLGYLVYCLDNCVMKLYIETGLKQNLAQIKNIPGAGCYSREIKLPARAYHPNAWRIACPQESGVARPRENLCICTLC